MRYEYVWQEKPSYLPVYIMAGFLLLGMITTMEKGFWKDPGAIGAAFMLLWNGFFVYWMLGFIRRERDFVHNTFEIRGTTIVSSTTAVAKKGKPSETDIMTLTEVMVCDGEDGPNLVVSSGGAPDIVFLPKTADVPAIIAEIKRIHPNIKVQDTWEKWGGK